MKKYNRFFLILMVIASVLPLSACKKDEATEAPPGGAVAPAPAAPGGEPSVSRTKAGAVAAPK